MSDLRIVLADDHAVVREGLKSLIDAHPGMVVVGEAADGRTACELVERLHPDVAVLDVSMPKMSGGQATERIRQSAASPTTTIPGWALIRAFRPSRTTKIGRAHV